MNVFIIIVTYNGMQWLEKCLHSIPANLEVIVVDNNSTDGTRDFLKDYPRSLHLILKDENIGFGQGNNEGIKRALSLHANAVFLLNQDAYLLPNTVTLLAQVSLKYPLYGILSPVHLDASMNRFDRKFSYYMGYEKNAHFHSDSFFKSLKEIYEIPFVNAAGWYIPAKTLENIGGFDPLFFHYGEDDNYCQRVKYHGLKICVVPGALLIHDRSERLEKKPKRYSQDDLKLQLRSVMMVTANINNHNGLKELRNRIQATKIIYCKKLISLKFDKAAYYKQLIVELKKSFKKIEASRNTNKTIGNHYI